VNVVRESAPMTLKVPTIAFRGRTVLGVDLEPVFERPALPVAVRYTLAGVAGSSGGLMFALDIYRSIRPEAGANHSRIAGTGTLSYDGKVGAIEGARQKVAAARRAGATMFLVPADNYREIAGTPDIRIVPVGTFEEAVNAARS